MNNDIKLINEILSATKEIVEGVDKGEISDFFAWPFHKLYGINPRKNERYRAKVIKKRRGKKRK